MLSRRRAAVHDLEYDGFAVDLLAHASRRLGDHPEQRPSAPPYATAAGVWEAETARTPSSVVWHPTSWSPAMLASRRCGTKCISGSSVTQPGRRASSASSSMPGAKLLASATPTSRSSVSHLLRVHPPLSSAAPVSLAHAVPSQPVPARCKPMTCRDLTGESLTPTCGMIAH
jgi:hypothetical protein